MKSVVILSSGLGSRLNPITNMIPKCLVNYHQHTILKHLHDLYTDLGADKIIVVVHSKFRQIVEAYAEYMNINVEVQTIDDILGSMHAIQNLEGLEGNIVFNWCDVIPEFNNFSWDENVIYTHGNKCRFNFDGKNLDTAMFGNVVGVYQIKDFKYSTKCADYACKDFVEYLLPKEFKQGKLKSVVDVGDFEKLKAAHANPQTCREFNQISESITGETIIKQAINGKGIELQKDELNWYLNSSNPAAAELIKFNAKEHKLVLEKIKGEPLAKCFKIELLPKLINTKFSEPKYFARQKTYDDVRKEMVTKVKARCEEISKLIDSIPAPRIVNRIPLCNLDTALERACRYIQFVHRNAPYEIIHGDLNFSNVLFDGELRFIDPRGYFGDTKLYGLKFYDEAKILYALSGYDKFNSDGAWSGFDMRSNLARIDIEALYDIESPEVKRHFEFKHYVMLAVIWISLAGYFKNNPYKAISAYYYGWYLLSKVYKEIPIITEDFSMHKIGEVQNFTLTTRCPEKWELRDLETGEIYNPCKNGGYDWKRQELEL